MLAATVDVSRTFVLLKEGEHLSASDVADIEIKLLRKPNDLEDRLRLLSFYAGQQSASDVEKIRDIRARHILWIIKNEPKAAVFDVATRVYALQRTGGPFADAAAFEMARNLWQSAISAHPRDNEIKRNAATFVEVQDPELAEMLLKETGDDRWRGQIYAKAILGIVALDYASSDPTLTDENRRNSNFSRHALAELDATNNATILGGAGFTLCRDGGMLYADGKLDWDYTPLAKRLLAKAEQIEPANNDVFSVVSVLPLRGERPSVTLRVGAAQTAKNLRSHLDPIYPPGARAPGTTGTVRLNVLIGLDGHVLRAVATSGPDELRDAAAAAVMQWTYSTSSLGGKPVYILTVVDVPF